MIPSGFDFSGKYAKINKDPAAKLPYTFNYTKWLTEMPGESIVTSTWTPPTGITVVTDSIIGGKQTQVVVTGGTVGTTYILVNHVITTSGYEDTRRMEFTIVER